MNTNSNVVTLITNEQALLAMADSDYMNAMQLGFFRGKLRAIKAALVEATSRPRGVLEESEMIADPSDRATAEESRQCAHAKRATDLQMLSHVCHSLAKIDIGEYGYCEATGEPIGLKRLLAKPTANLTVEEQARRERQLRRYLG